VHVAEYSQARVVESKLSTFSLLNKISISSSIHHECEKRLTVHQFQVFGRTACLLHCFYLEERYDPKNFNAERTPTKITFSYRLYLSALLWINVGTFMNALNIMIPTECKSVIQYHVWLKKRDPYIYHFKTQQGIWNHWIMVYTSKRSRSVSWIWSRVNLYGWYSLLSRNNTICLTF
jgi:hypothetical protein